LLERFADTAEVERLAALLAASGFSCWRDRNLTAGACYLKQTVALLCPLHDKEIPSGELCSIGRIRVQRPDRAGP